MQENFGTFFFKKEKMWSTGGPMVKKPSASGGDMGSILGQRLHMLQGK